MSLSVVRASDWELVMEAAKRQATCIRPGAGNHATARDQWVSNPPNNPRVVYYLQYDSESPDPPLGYIRLLRVCPSPDIQASTFQTWVVDYVMPFSYLACLLVARDFPHPLLVRVTSAPDHPWTYEWRKLVLGLTGLDKHTWKQTHSYEESWLLVPVA